MKPGTMEEITTLKGMGPLHVLIVEPSHNGLEPLLRELRSAGLPIDYTLAENREQFRRAMQSIDLSAVISSHQLPRWMGAEVLLLSKETGRELPLLLFTDEESRPRSTSGGKESENGDALQTYISRLAAALARIPRDGPTPGEIRRTEQDSQEDEAKARKHLKELEVIYHSVPVGFAVFDRNLCYVRINDELARDHNLSPEEHVGRSIHEVIPQISQEVAMDLRRVFETGEAVRDVERAYVSTKDAEPSWHTLASYYPLRGEDGSIFAVCAVVVDITERKRAEEALRVSEARYRTQIEHAPEAIVVVDVDKNCFVEANRNAEILFGRPREELLRLNPVDLSPRFQPDGSLSSHGARSHLRAALQGGMPVFEWIHLNSAGEEVPCEVRLIRMPSPTENLVRGSLSDIRERRRAEQALRSSEARNRDLVEHSIYGISRVSADGAFLDANPALLSILGCNTSEELQDLNLLRDVFRFPEQHVSLMASCRERGQVQGAETEWRRRDGGIVAVRLHLRMLSIPQHAGAVEIIAEDVTELRTMERQLRQSQKFEAIGQLAGGVAHDFNNVVGAILGWAELGVEQNRANPPVAERFSRIREQAERAAALTRELLAFARRQVLQPQAVDINAIASGLVSFLDKVIGKDIELKVITAPVDVVKADPTQLEQVLMNLCLNSRDAMPEGGRLLIETEMVELDESYCRFYPHVAPGRYAVLSVSDTGSGMDAETRERIFEPFFTTKERGKGTGMGLATAYGIVKQHGGFIHVYSEPSQGTLFRVYLPAMEGTPAEDSTAKVPVPAISEMRGSETIVIAEDHESIREMARQTLLNLGYRVLAASDGAEALRLCDKAPAMAILDVVMPKLGGTAVAAKLEAMYPSLPILFTSGYSQDSDNLAPAISQAHYLQKPYSPTSLGRMVREILDQAKQPRKESA